MDETAVKESRVILRQVQEHLILSHRGQGAHEENAGLVDILYNPASAQGELNYVMPRRNTAWVTGSYIEAGLSRLRGLGRRGRFQYVEGLFPAQFGQTLARLGLEAQYRLPLFVYRAAGIDGVLPPRPTLALADDTRLKRVLRARGLRVWQQVLSSGAWDVATLGVVPVNLSDTEDAQIEVDLVTSRHRAPAGIVRVSLCPDNDTAHLVAVGVRHDAQELRGALVAAGVKAALRCGCGVVLAGAQAQPDRQMYREAGFVELGSIVCYADVAHDLVAQPVSAH